jgi:hypothetical protein
MKKIVFLLGITAVVCAGCAGSPFLQAFSPQDDTPPQDSPHIRIAGIIRTATGVDISYPTYNTYAYNTLPAAPLTVLSDGSLAVLATGSDGNLLLVHVDLKAGAVTTSGLQKDGWPGAIATDGRRIAYVAKTGNHRVDFRFVGRTGKDTVIMDNQGDNPGTKGVRNSGKGLIFRRSSGGLEFGTEAMYAPFIFGRVELSFLQDRWVTSFPHTNNFNASDRTPGEYKGDAQNYHCGECILSFCGPDGGQPKLLKGWGASHSMDLRALAAGDVYIHVSVGDVYPSDFRFYSWDSKGEKIAETDLFGSMRFPDTLIGRNMKNEDVYGVAGGPPGVAARLGDLVQVGADRYMLTYAIRPGQYPNSYTAAGGSFSTEIDELALLVLDRRGTVLQRTRLRKGSDVEFLQTALYGRNVLVAWKTAGSTEYWMMLVDPAGSIVQGPTRLGRDVFFNASDGFKTLPDGGVVWSAAGLGMARKTGEMFVFVLPPE